MSKLRLFMIGFWSIFAISLSILLMTITRNKKLPLNMARNFWSPVILWAAGARVKVIGKQNIDLNNSYLIVSNHQSFLDIAILFNSIPVNLHFLGKEELKKMPFIGWFMKSMGMVFVDRKDRRKSLLSLRDASDLIKSGKSVMIFPEGTRSKTGEVRMFKKGGFFIAQHANANLVPVLIQGANKVWPTGGGKVKPGDVTITIGEPFAFNDLGEKDLAVFADKVKEKVLALSN